MTDEFSKLTAKEYACMHLQLPQSGTPWLDALIREKRIEDIAVKLLIADKSLHITSAVPLALDIAIELDK